METRGWSTNYRGPVLIHASRAFPNWAALMFEERHFREVLREMHVRHPTELPCGFALATVDLAGCQRTEAVRDHLTEREFSFGNYANGRWAWRFSNLRPLARPMFVTGHLGLWDIEDKLEQAVLENIAA